jgi:hypothetical protein
MRYANTPINNDIAVSPAPTFTRKEIAFIDTAIADWQTLAAGIRPGVEVVLIDGSRDGLAQMAEWAQSHTGYDAIHVLSHGSEGSVQLGTLRLTAGNLQDHATHLETIGAARPAVVWHPVTGHP